MSSLHALAVALAARVPVVLWGPPGSGKSSAVKALAEATGQRCEVVIASIREPSDFAGLPVVDRPGSASVDQPPRVHFAPPAWAQSLSDAGGGVLFLDEISTAPPAVQAALLRVVLERTVGDLQLPDDVAVVAAANPPDQAADGWDLSGPLANRFCHLDWVVEPGRIVEGFVGGFPLPRSLSLPEGWDAGVGAARAQVAAFLAARPGLVSAPPGDRALAGRAWPSPRSWEMAARLVAAARAAQSAPGTAAESDVLPALVRGCVGDGAGLELLSWMAELDLPDPETLLADPASVELPERGDRAYAVLLAVAAAVAANPTADRWSAGWQVLGRAGESVPDVAATAARVLAGCRPEGADAPPEAAAFVPLLRAAGLL